MSTGFSAEPSTSTSQTSPPAAPACSSDPESSILGSTSLDALNVTVDPSDPSSTSSAVPLSKNAQKRLRKAALWESTRLERRQQERASKKAKQAHKRQLVAEGLLDPIELESAAAKKKRKVKEAGGKFEKHGAKIVVDLGFDELMTETEIKSMASQLGYCYSANRNALKPFDLIMTSLNGRLQHRLESTQGRPHEHWKGVRWMTDPYTSLYTTTTTHDHAPEIEKSSVIYLTGDSPHVLSTIDPTKTYILGGIVDRNRYKSLCLSKAEKDGIAHAQLPIGEYLAEMPTRKVLTVNQVYEIMVRFVECGDWNQTLREVMPLRKMTHGTPGANKSKKEQQARSNEGDEEEEATRGAIYVVREEGDDEEEMLSAAGEEEANVAKADDATEERSPSETA